jgi:hypothetical protein
MIVKAKEALPRNYKSVGISFEVWEKLNSMEEVELDSIPEKYKNKIEVISDNSKKVEQKAPKKKEVK